MKSKEAQIILHKNYFFNKPKYNKLNIKISLQQDEKVNAKS